MKKFWHRLEAALKKIFGSTTWEKTTSGIITYVAPLLETLIALTAGGPAAALATSIINTVQTDLATVSAVVSGATATPPANELQAAVGALNSIKANLGQLLAAAEIKNSGKQAEITLAVNTIVGEIDACLENVPALATPASK